MRKLAIIFVVAVLVPSMVLAWLAFRSLRDQQYILERQQTLLYQGLADSVAQKVQRHLLDEQERFVATVGSLFQTDTNGSMGVTSGFDPLIRSNWPLAKVGFVAFNGELLSPARGSSLEAQKFYVANSGFINNDTREEVYQNSIKVQSAGPASQNISSLEQTQQAFTKERRIVPQNFTSQAALPAPEVRFSKFPSLKAEFRELVSGNPKGIVGRFAENQLNLLVWHQPNHSPELVFGAQIDLEKLVEDLKPLIRAIEPFSSDVCLALVNDSGKPVALSTNGFAANWKRPFVATEVGEELPHWEVAVYLLNPDQVGRSAETARLLLGMLIAILVLTIGIGGFLIVFDIKRQMALARQKTDFVSNVSHELKTPLTSIRMFSELLAEGRVSEPDKQRSYLNIISLEAGRLTRLINNVLDFARMERGEKNYQLKKCDFTQLVREMCDTFRPQLEESGFRFTCCVPERKIDLMADRDALAQVIVNLLSNAEKFSGKTREIELNVEVTEGSAPQVMLSVADRGSGIPAGYEEKVFEQFFRVHDALSSGIQGSGLGLTLARQIARAHDGDVIFRRREGGGSCFILQLPITP